MDKICTQTFGLGKEFSEDLLGTIEKLHALGFDDIEPFLLFNPEQGEILLRMERDGYAGTYAQEYSHPEKYPADFAANTRQMKMHMHLFG